MRISDWSSDVCSSDLVRSVLIARRERPPLPGLSLIAERRGPPHRWADARYVSGRSARAQSAVVPHRSRWKSSRDRGDQPHRLEAKPASRLAKLARVRRSEEHTSELQALMRHSND